MKRLRAPAQCASLKSINDMSKIIARSHKKTSAYAEKIEKNRKEILDLDLKMIRLLGQRMSLAAKLGKIKKDIGANVVDKNREEKLFAFWAKKAVKAGLNPKFVTGLWKIILKESVRIQNHVKKS